MLDELNTRMQWNPTTWYLNYYTKFDIKHFTSCSSSLRDQSWTGWLWWCRWRISKNCRFQQEHWNVWQDDYSRRFKRIFAKSSGSDIIAIYSISHQLGHSVRKERGKIFEYPICEWLKEFFRSLLDRKDLCTRQRLSVISVILIFLSKIYFCHSFKTILLVGLARTNAAMKNFLSRVQVMHNHLRRFTEVHSNEGESKWKEIKVKISSLNLKNELFSTDGF